MFNTPSVMIIKNDPDIIAGYLEDASGFLGGRADRLVLPETPAEVADYLAQAAGRREPVTVSGGGTGVAAGRIPLAGTLMSLERLNRLGRIESSPAGGELFAEPAVRLAEVKAAAEQAGLIYPPDPTERTSTLGGNVATNASGGRSFKYGPTRDHVLGLTVAFTTGETLTLRRGECLARGDDLTLAFDSGRTLVVPRPLLPPVAVAKNAAGYFSAANMDAVDLFIGMEGTLGVITGIRLKLSPAPAGGFSLAVFLPSQKLALEHADRIRPSASGRAPSPGLCPAALEFMDDRSLHLLRPAFPAIPAGAEACLLLEQEYALGAETEALSAWQAFWEQAGIPDDWIWLGADAAGQERLRAFRHALPETVNTIVRARRLPKVGTDMAVPAEAFAGMFNFYATSLKTLGLDYLIFGHIGDCHLHVNILPRTAEEFRQAREFYLGFAAEAVRRRGTISAEHGIGKLKHDFLELMVGPSGLQEMVRVKRLLDPAGILNRGNIFPAAAL